MRKSDHKDSLLLIRNQYQCLGAGGKSAAKDIKDNLSWWGISQIKVCSFKLMSEVHWEKIPENKKAAIAKKLGKAAKQLSRIDYTEPAHTSLMTKAKFYAVRILQKKLGKDNPAYTDYQYWKNNGRTGAVRPWKQ